MKHFFLFVFPLVVCVARQWRLAGWELREARGSVEGGFAIEPCSRTLGFSALDRVSPQRLFGVKVKEVSIRRKLRVLANLVKCFLQTQPG